MATRSARVNASASSYDGGDALPDCGPRFGVFDLFRLLPNNPKPFRDTGPRRPL